MTDAYTLLTGFLRDRFAVPAAELTEDTTFTDLGMDSLDLGEMAVLVRKAHGLALEDVRAGSTLREAADRLDAARRAAAPAAGPGPVA
ncbi:acyl carrier protein [Streptomyces griseocarneus]|uniref:acyl carrier protein n=1 Tax=Streptomyces griseocarneus TaxID=51201 RepID=UPI00167EFE4D|nr:acyl carrier protein [Streptomyces griseocarneus]MBZ6476197.1 acyl carrier protein [Streptomyces griseocarneus]GHG63451.1 hypothetical protein GCM10018779_33060 [Streptomyces griseocarneus]